MRIVAITGNPASGKDTIADYLVEKGFTKIVGGDIIRKVMVSQGIPVDRQHIHDFFLQERRQTGNSYPMDVVIDLIKGDSVICGIRNLSQLNKLREKFGDNLKLISVDAPIEIRYKRALERKTARDTISFEDFKKQEDQERDDHLGSFEVDLVMEKADFKIINDSDMISLYKKIDEILLK